MKRLEFIKKLFTASAVVAVSPNVFAKTETKNEYLFNEIFEVWKGNDRLIYPKKDSFVYKEIVSSIEERITEGSTPTYLPEHRLSLPVKEKYTLDELKPLKFYFECVYNNRQKFSTEHGVVFRMIKNASDRMYLDVFLNYKY